MRRFPLRSLALGVVPLIGALIGGLLLVLVAPVPAAAQSAAQPTPTEVIYFADTAPFRAHLGENQQWLEAIVKAMTTGHADEVTTDELGNLTREIFAAQQGFAQASPSARLEMYDQLVKTSVDRAYTASVMLLKAQVTESGPKQVSLVKDAATYTASSGKLLKEAGDALRDTSLMEQ